MPKGAKYIDLSSNVLDVLNRINVSIDPLNFESCHWLNSRNSDTKVILNLSKLKDSDNIHSSDKNKKMLI